MRVSAVSQCKKSRGSRRATCCATILLAALGCAGPVQQSSHDQEQPAALYHATSQPATVPETLVERPEFRLGVGDSVTVGFNPRLRSTPAREVRVEVGDAVSLRFPYDAKYDQRLNVQADGKIRLLLLGPVRAAGLTLDELTEQLRAGYARYIREPELTVDVTATDSRPAAARQMLAGSARPSLIKPDGTIDLPYLGEVIAAGRTVKALRTDLAHRCDEAGLDDVDISVEVAAFAPRRLYVVGEVAAAGRIDATNPTSLVQALSAAGGITTRGDGRHVLLVRRLGLPLPQATVIDYERLMTASRRTVNDSGADGSIFRYDPWLADGDIVYVPTTGLARSGDWIDQVFTRGLRSVLPYEARTGLDLGYQLNTSPVRAVARVRP